MLKRIAEIDLSRGARRGRGALVLVSNAGLAWTRCIGLMLSGSSAKLVLVAVFAGLVGANVQSEEGRALNTKTDGYRGVWYQNQKLDSEYRFKYSGGLGTYCAKHQPFAVYNPATHRTYFCYGGVPDGYEGTFDLTQSLDRLTPDGSAGGLHHLVSYFDHATGTLPQPTVLLDKRTHDAHDNPVISLDDEGHIWIFSTSHGTLRPSFVHRSDRPHDIASFVRVEPYRMVAGEKRPITNFSYMQAWNVPGRGFVFFFTKYEKWRRETCFAVSADGAEWTDWTQLADIEEGHYQISAATADKAACAFNYHPLAFGGDPGKKGLNWRTNLYYLETSDLGKTWKAADGTPLEPPLTEPHNAALVHDFEKDGRLVYLKDIVFDGEGRPLILFLTSSGFEAGPESGPRTWHIARWTGQSWSLSEITNSDNNYDMGSLYVEENDMLRVIAPTGTGPQPGNPGGEVTMWISGDGGRTWRKERQLTTGSVYNHSYVRRPVDAHPGFYGFWADGHGREPSTSRLYFCTRDGDVYRMPPQMVGDRHLPGESMAANGTEQGGGNSVGEGGNTQK